MFAFAARLALALSLASVTFMSERAHAAHLPRIWLAPMQLLQRPDGAQAGSTDYFAMFEPGAPWEFAATHVSVFKIYSDLLRDATDDQIRRVISGLAERNISLGLESPVLVDPSQCETVEGREAWVIGLVARLKRLHGDLRTFAMVGPLIDGHSSSRPGACHRSIPDVAAEAAHTVAAIRQFYPDLVVGEIEPIGHGSDYPDWHELRGWLDAWAKASGKPLAFLHMDTVWGTPWHDDMREVASQTRKAGIRFGVIYKGDPSDLSDGAFTQDALQHADEVEGVLAGPPDDVILQSWENYPRHALPDTDFGTMTGLVRAYVRPHTQFSVEGSHRIRLIREDGAAVAGAKVIVDVHNPALGQTVERETIAGFVPHSATRALFALRVHEECDCEPLPVTLSLSGYEFLQRAPMDNYHGDLYSWSSRSATDVREIALSGVPALKIEAGSNRQILLNGPEFRVIADQPFALTFYTQVEPAGERTGYVALIFLGSNGIEIQRVPKFFLTSWKEFKKVLANSDGGFALPSMPIVSGSIVRLRFGGDIMNRPSVLLLDSGHLAAL
jgi:hypothetical protein